jgi:hypothetical protein
MALFPLNPMLDHPLSVLHVHDTSDAISLLHILKRIIDVFKGLAVRDELVHLELALHVVVNQVGQLGAAFDSAKGTSLYSRQCLYLTTGLVNLPSKHDQ